jgi:hypothetical protein
MANTFSEKVRGMMGNKAFRVYEVTSDGSTTINATDIGMNYIEYAIMSPKTALSSDAADYPRISGTTTGTYITVVAQSASAVDIIEAWGW